MKLFSSIIIVIILSTALQSNAQYVPTEQNLKARELFKEAKFGLFIHWGVYSVLGNGEWVMNNKNISVEEYEKLPAQFNPVKFDAAAWVKMAKDAGMKYITITSRHHDGFSMFDTEMSDYNIVDQTPYGKDVLKMLAEECRKQDIKLFFYYSLLDWNRDDYFPRGRTGKGIEGRGEGEWEDYIAFMKGQLKELLTNYGEIGGIWFDGHWDQVTWDGKKFGELNVDWHYNEIYGMIHELQPQALIGNNHHVAVIEGEDFQMFEKDLPGKNTTGWGTPADDIGSVPLEVCETINGSWGYNSGDKKHKSRKELIQYIVKAAGYGSNLLLNVGPMPTGEIQEQHVKSLKEMGDWLEVNGETIYGTTAGPVPPNDKWVSTQKGNVVYLHLLKSKYKEIRLENIDVRIKSVKMFGTGKKVKFKQEGGALVIDTKKLEMNDVDTILEISTN